MAFISHECKMNVILFLKNNYLETFYISALTLNFLSFCYFKGLKLKNCIFWLLLASKSKFKWPILCSDTHRLCSINCVSLLTVVSEITWMYADANKWNQLVNIYLIWKLEFLVWQIVMGHGCGSTFGISPIIWNMILHVLKRQTFKNKA